MKLRAGLLAAMGLFAAHLAACDSINDQPHCSFACGSFNASACPDDYTCAADGYCHQIGYTGTCGFSDLGVEMSASADMQPDLAGVDQGALPSNADLFGGADLSAVPDLSTTD